MNHRTVLRLLTLLIVGMLCAPVCRAEDRRITPPPFESITELTDDHQAALAAWLTGQLESGGYPSLSVGIITNGKLAHTVAVGTADREANRPATPDTIYRIGSITKVFTATLMGALRDDGVVRFDDPVGKFLPQNLPGPAAADAPVPITLQHLACHTSGLPRLPDNRTPRPTPNGPDPYGGYTAKQLYTALARLKLATPPGLRASYSNLGAGLLGHALERAAGKPYESLIAEHITQPIGMADTVITLSEDQRARAATGSSPRDPAKPAVEWDLGVLAPAGALASTVPDLAGFIEMQFRAIDDEPGLPIAGATLRELMQPQPRKPGDDGPHGIGWAIADHPRLGQLIWHNGGLDGFMSYMALCPDHRTGVIVLTNRGGKGVEPLGVWLLERLTPPQATSSAPTVP